MNIRPKVGAPAVPQPQSNTPPPLTSAPEPPSFERARGLNYTTIQFIADVGTTATYGLAGLGVSALLGVPVVGASVAATAMAYTLGRWGLWAVKNS